MVKPAAERKNRHHPPAKSASRGPKQRLGNFFSAAAKNGGENSQQSTVNAVGFAIIFEKSCDGHAYLERYRYDAYGNRTVLSPVGTVFGAKSLYGNSVGFTGRYHDQETGLTFFRARYFDPVLGRFIGRDPLGYVDGMSLYSAYFAPNDLDPDGLSCLKWVKLVAAKKAEIAVVNQVVAHLRAKIELRVKQKEENLGHQVPPGQPRTPLPMKPPYPGAPDRDSVHGHNKLIAEGRGHIRNRQAELSKLERELSQAEIGLAECLAFTKGAKFCKKIPVVGIFAGIFAWNQVVEDKGYFWGTVDTGLDMIPIFGTAKGIAEGVGGQDLVGENDE
jgi:RHS repeat-associated protein